MQILKCLNLFESQPTYYDYLNFMGTLQQGNRLGILSILVVIFRSGYNFYIYIMRKLLY